MDFKIVWTLEALSNLENILSYLAENWSQREIDHFKTRLSKQIGYITNFPDMFPVSLFNSKVRKAVLSKQTTVFYRKEAEIIYIVSMFVNAKDFKKIRKL
ncbi:MAG: type II toxin-antitoxin system RelE/ParE family toxin [Draconibacterium sp.]